MNKGESGEPLKQTLIHKYKFARLVRKDSPGTTGKSMSKDTHVQGHWVLRGTSICLGGLWSDG